MQRCIIEGHKPVLQNGVGPYARQIFLVCSQCGSIIDIYKQKGSVEEMEAALDHGMARGLFSSGFFPD